MVSMSTMPATAPTTVATSVPTTGGCFSNDAEAATVFVVVLFGRSGGSDYRNACQKKIRIITSASAASKALEANTPTT